MFIHSASNKRQTKQNTGCCLSVCLFGGIEIFVSGWSVGYWRGWREVEGGFELDLMMRFWSVGMVIIKHSQGESKKRRPNYLPVHARPV